MGVAGSVLLMGCSDGKEPIPASTPQVTASSPTPESRPTTSGLQFQRKPTGEMGSARCQDDSDTWALSIDSDPDDYEKPPFDTLTLGAPQEHDVEGRPIFLAGATVKALGKSAYEVATSDDAPGESTIINLNESSYARVLRGETGKYDVVFSARKSPGDGHAYFSLNCLFDHGFIGNREKAVPLPPPDEQKIPEPAQPPRELQI